MHTPMTIEELREVKYRLDNVVEKVSDLSIDLGDLNDELEWLTNKSKGRCFIDTHKLIEEFIKVGGKVKQANRSINREFDKRVKKV